jgi:hypothetical protein
MNGLPPAGYNFLLWERISEALRAEGGYKLTTIVHHQLITAS